MPIKHSSLKAIRDQNLKREIELGKLNSKQPTNKTTKEKEKEKEKTKVDKISELI